LAAPYGFVLRARSLIALAELPNFRPPFDASVTVDMNTMGTIKKRASGKQICPYCPVGENGVGVFKTNCKNREHGRARLCLIAPSSSMLFVSQKPSGIKAAAAAAAAASAAAEEENDREEPEMTLPDQRPPAPR
jgi:hypothetical protein